ncbi:V-type ATP synthase subunit F [Calorimonas adulescens]|uniref:V-type ATP synthase subunit F n=1 Tax=Calorimonas adulescens TaxID=2606906 RepID=A0A5D8Q8Z6_9THEO|nr:V-type ATP synthase subunit F [Calorimonas adulescens]TZE81245.1 V-type ATP synthase subunit F [Calorimonas adulescens]
MYKIGVMGDTDTVLAFKALGIDTFPVKEDDDPDRILLDIVKKDYAVIFVTENIAERIGDTIKEFSAKPLPSIILIPNNQGSRGIGITSLKYSVEKAIGTDIIFRKEGETS